MRKNISFNQVVLMRKEYGKKDFVKLVAPTRIWLEGRDETLALCALFERRKYSELVSIMESDRLKTDESMLDTYRLCEGDYGEPVGGTDLRGKLKVFVRNIEAMECLEMVVTVGEVDGADSLFSKSRAVLPTNCKNCAAPLHGHECAYCGTRY